MRSGKNSVTGHKKEVVASDENSKSEYLLKINYFTIINCLGHG